MASPPCPELSNIALSGPAASFMAKRGLVFPRRAKLATSLKCRPLGFLKHQPLFRFSLLWQVRGFVQLTGQLCSAYTRSFLVTVPDTSVKRKSRPWNR